jgi:hypothetical protein
MIVPELIVPLFIVPMLVMLMPKVFVRVGGARLQGRQKSDTH